MTTSTASLLSISLLAFGTTAAATLFIIIITTIRFRFKTVPKLFRNMISPVFFMRKQRPLLCWLLYWLLCLLYSWHYWG